MTRYVDLSIPLDPEITVDPPLQPVEIEYIAHDEGAAEMVAAFPGLTVGDLPDGKGWARERVRFTTHNGTHMDAPWHYHPTTDGGRPAATIDQIPLDWCMRPGVRLDFRDLPDGHVVGPDEIDAKLDEIGYRLEPFDIVLCNTRAGERLGQDDYLDAGCGFGRAATLHLAHQGVKVVGTDAWSWDPPFSATAKRYAETKDAALVWEGHKAGRDVSYCQLEKLHGLEQLPPFGFTVVCFPVKVARASAGWSRVVALLPD